MIININNSNRMKKLLILGGKPIGSVEMVQKAKRRGYHVIVTDYLPPEESPAKRYADESWNISTADIDKLERMCRDYNVDGILTAVHEFNINRMIDLCERLDKPCYCKRDTWLYCDDKTAFKLLCSENAIDVAKRYYINYAKESEKEEIRYPVVTKPVDGSGSRGFTICHNEVELSHGIKHALDFSPGKHVLIEDYIPYNAVIIHYTMFHGKCYFSGISDKYSEKFKSTGASVMGLQIFPSKGIDAYLTKVDAKARKMFENAGFTDGPIWIEAFYDGKDKFIFNEMGYRFGGSLTNYPVQYFYGIDQLSLMLDVAMDEQNSIIEKQPKPLKVRKRYCILPIHVNPGTISKVSGINEVCTKDDVNALVPVHFVGDIIQDWGSAQQVFCYMHILFDDITELRDSITSILGELRAENENGVNLLFTLYNLNKLQEL